MNHHPFPLLLFAVLAPVLLFVVGCTSSLGKTTPKLPPGFLDTQVPNVELNAYLYVSLEDGVTVSLNSFGEQVDALAQIPAIGKLEPEVDIDSLVAWVGSDRYRFGARVTFQQELWAQMATGLLSYRSDDVRSWRDGKKLNLVSLRTDWADSLEEALRSGDDSGLETTYPDIWELFHLMPENPPEEPVAAGFVRVGGGLLDSFAAMANLDISGVGRAFGAINASEIVFVIYSGSPLAVPEDIGRDYFQEASVGAIFVAKSSYPAFILSFFLGTFADSVGLEEGTVISGEDVLSRDLEGMYVLVKPLGSTIFLAMAPSRQEAKALMGSVLESRIE